MLIAIILAQLAQVLRWALPAVVGVSVVRIALEPSSHLKVCLGRVLLALFDFGGHVVLDVGAVAYEIPARKHLV